MVQNKCTPETIHVANWYLANAERLTNLFKLSYVEKQFEETTATVTDFLCENLCDDLADVLNKSVGFHDWRGELLEDEEGEEYYAPFNSFNGYDALMAGPLGGPADALVVPLLHNAFQQVNFHHVAELLLDHAPAVKVA